MTGWAFPARDRQRESLTGKPTRTQNTLSLGVDCLWPALWAVEHIQLILGHGFFLTPTSIPLCNDLPNKDCTESRHLPQLDSFRICSFLPDPHTLTETLLFYLRTPVYEQCTTLKTWEKNAPVQLGRSPHGRWRAGYRHGEAPLSEGNSTPAALIVNQDAERLVFVLTEGNAAEFLAEQLAHYLWVTRALTAVGRKIYAVGWLRLKNGRMLPRMYRVYLRADRAWYSRRAGLSGLVGHEWSLVVQPHRLDGRTRCADWGGRRVDG